MITLWNSAAAIACRAAMINCVYSANVSGQRGGAVYNHDGSPTLTNCTLFGNKANEGGGVFSSSGSSPALVNCIVWNNHDASGETHEAQFSACWKCGAERGGA